MNETTMNQLYGTDVLDVSAIQNKCLDISYGDAERNRFDLYFPENGTGPFPLILFFNGGAFFKGDKRRYQLKAALSGITHGYAVAGINYRLAPADPLPAAFADGYRVLAYIKQHAAQLNIDADRIALWGESAGASIACMAGFHPDHEVYRRLAGIPEDADLSVQAVVDWYAPLNLNQLTLGNEVIRQTLTGTEGEAAVRILAQCDPSEFLKEEIPPVRIEHGTNDEVVPAEESMRLYCRLLKILPMEQVQLNIVENAGHGVHDFENEENVSQVFRFLDRFVRGIAPVR